MEKLKIKIWKEPIHLFGLDIGSHNNVLWIP